MTNASTVAKYIVATFQGAGDPVDNLKLQKLLYYVQGWHLAVYGEPAFADDFEAWVHGPVLPGIYVQYKKYRWNPITEPVEKPNIDKELAGLIQEVLDVYGTESGWQLEQRTHTEAPWLKARKGLARDEESHAVISKPSMKAFFDGLKDGE
jgi:uncharacterized phage-associated protein